MTLAKDGTNLLKLEATLVRWYRNGLHAIKYFSQKFFQQWRESVEAGSATSAQRTNSRPTIFGHFDIHCFQVS